MPSAAKQRLVLASLFFTIALPAQEFEVASVRPHSGPLRNIADFKTSGPRIKLGCYNMTLLVREAFGLSTLWQVSFKAFPGSDELMSAYYDITASAPADHQYSRAQFRPMLQALLKDRFALTFHRETKQTSVYALTQGKNISKLKHAAAEAECSVHVSVTLEGQDYQLLGCPLDKLVEVLNQGLADRLVENRTTLSGNYDFHFIATFANRDGSLFNAMQELGFKLQARAEPQEILVIDHFSSPTPN